MHWPYTGLKLQVVSPQHQVAPVENNHLTFDKDANRLYYIFCSRDCRFNVKSAREFQVAAQLWAQVCLLKEMRNHGKASQGHG
jgi:hypothetical protein